MVGFKVREMMDREKIINRMIDTFELEAILEYNDIPDQAVLESLIENDYINEADLIEQLSDEGFLDDEIDEVED